MKTNNNTSILLWWSVLAMTLVITTCVSDNKITNAEKLGFPAGKKVILLHIDDAGMCDEANIATRHYFENGNLQSAAVMVPCPYADDLIEWAKKQKSPDIGVHLTPPHKTVTYI